MNHKVTEEEYNEYILRVNNFIDENSDLLRPLSESNNIMNSKEIIDPDFFKVTNLSSAILNFLVKCKSGVKGNQSKEISEKLTLISAFIQGFKVTENLILSGQYIKASAVLKQDFEILTRIREINIGKQTFGKTPNAKYAPNGMQFLYGKFNDIAHISKGHILSFYLAEYIDEEKGVSPKAKIKENQLKSFYTYYLAIIFEIASESVSLYKDMYGIDDNFKAVRIYIEHVSLIINKIGLKLMRNTNKT